jgi:hypothetical protein
MLLIIGALYYGLDIVPNFTLICIYDLSDEWELCLLFIYIFWECHDFIYLIFRFLWRKNATFAISRHYKRFDVFTEAEANKAAKKYDNASIDFQINFYKSEGLTPYSEAKLPITSGRCKFLFLFLFS